MTTNNIQGGLMPNGIINPDRANLQAIMQRQRFHILPTIAVTIQIMEKPAVWFLGKLIGICSVYFSPIIAIAEQSIFSYFFKTNVLAYSQEVVFALIKSRIIFLQDLVNGALNFIIIHRIIGIGHTHKQGCF